MSSNDNLNVAEVLINAAVKVVGKREVLKAVEKLYGMKNPNDCSGNSVEDGGTLVCGTFANPCSGEIYKQGPRTSSICNPASASNVPGPSVLCWNTKVQSWFPKQRYFMNNSTDKWPINYKGFVSAIDLSNCQLY
jgi:hypothetical protein